MEESFDFEKLAREIVASRLAGAANADSAAAEIARKIIVTAVASTKVRQDPRLTVRAVCRGVMSGLLLLDQPMPPAAVAVLKQMPHVAQDVPLAPGDLMTWGMEGIAEAAAMAGLELQSKVHDEIEASFMGAGEVFKKLCERAARGAGA